MIARLLSRLRLSYLRAQALAARLELRWALAHMPGDAGLIHAKRGQLEHAERALVRHRLRTRLAEIHRAPITDAEVRSHG